MPSVQPGLRPVLRLAPVAAALLFGLSACGGGGGGGAATGTAQFKLTDAPVCANYSSVVVTVTAVELIGESGTFTLTLPTPQQVDLTTLVNGTTLNLGSITLPAGNYTQMRLLLASNNGNSSPNNYITLSGSTTHVPLTTPSAQTSGLKINGEFTVAANGQANLTIDFNACRSVVLAGNSGNYLLKPVINLLDDDASGSISGTLDTAGAVVMAEDAQGHILKSTVSVANAGGASFTLSPVPASATPYNIVIAPPATLATGATAPSPNFIPVVVTGVPVNAGVTTQLSASPIALGTTPPTDVTYNGTVTLNGDADTLIVAQEALSSPADTISLAFQNAEEDSATSQSYSLVLPTTAPFIAAYSSTGPLNFTTATLASTGITVSAFASDGERGDTTSSTNSSITMFGSADDTYQLDH